MHSASKISSLSLIPAVVFAISMTGLAANAQPSNTTTSAPQTALQAKVKAFLERHANASCIAVKAGVADRVDFQVARAQDYPGQDFDLDSLEFVPVVVQRRV